MHDIRLIRDDPDAFDKGLTDRGAEAASARLLVLDDARRAAVAAAQAGQERRNALAREIGAAKKAKDERRAAQYMAEVADLKERSPALEAAEKEADAALRTALAELPNTPAPDVPVGPDETGNTLRHEWGKPVALANPRQHFELGEAWPVGIGTAMDFAAAAKLSGSRFVVLRGQLARLERALGQFMLDLHTTKHGYTEVSPPLMVRDEVMFGTAQLPKFKDDQFAAINLGDAEKTISELPVSTTDYPSSDGDWQYRFAGEEPSDPVARQSAFDRVNSLLKSRLIDHARRLASRWLIPTAEVPLTNLVREQILSEADLPLRFTALTPCFRAEAGAAGRDTRGMLRQHQFAKCELVSITTPEQSEEEHERMLGCAEAVLKALELPYRVMTLCTGDMGFASRKTYDIEVWVPGQATFREISSCSNCGDFQARRMEARYRPREGKGPRFVHTLNGSGVAVGRALIAVLENGQQPDGSVVIPSALRPYMGGLERIGAD